MGDKITIATAEKFLAQDIAPTVAVVNQAIKVPVTQNEFDACVSLAFNVGTTAFNKLTLVKRINRKLLEFLHWNKSGERLLAGLTKRRKAEMKLYNT